MSEVNWNGEESKRRIVGEETYTKVTKVREGHEGT